MALRDRYQKYLPDPYPDLERAAIQSEEDLPEEPCPHIPGFDHMPPITMTERRAILTRIYGWKYPPANDLATSTTDAGAS